MGRLGMHIGHWWGRKRLLGRPRRKFLHDIKKALGEIGRGNMEETGKTV
jgi:hypothetical protein